MRAVSTLNDSPTKSAAFLAEPKKIVLIPPRFIGDAVLHVPLLRHLKTYFPKSDLALVVPKAAQALLQGCPYVDTWLTESKASPLNKSLKTMGFDTALITRPSPSAAWQCRQAAIPRRLGFRWQRLAKNRFLKTAFGLTHSLPYPALDTQQHHVEHLNRFLELWGKSPSAEDSYLELWPSSLQDKELRALLQEWHCSPEGPMAVVHLSAASEHKSIALPHWALSIKHLEREGYQVLLTGTQADRASYQTLIDRFKLEAINTAGLLKLEHLSPLLAKAALLLSLDSAPIHIATAVGTPAIIGFYGATNETQWAAYRSRRGQPKFTALALSLPCRPCMPKVCYHNQCRESWTSTALLQGLLTALARY